MATVTEGYVPEERLVEAIQPLQVNKKTDDDESSDDQEKEGGEEDPNDENIAPDESQPNTDRKPRRELPPATVQILKNWMLSPEHVKHPYPTDDDKKMLLEKTGINMKQLTNWFTNARKRIWKPMMRREHFRQVQNIPRDVPPSTNESISSQQNYEQKYEQLQYPQDRSYPLPQMMERRTSLPQVSEYQSRQHDSRSHVGQYTSVAPPSRHHYTPSHSSPYPFGEFPTHPQHSGYFPPRQNRSASESVAHHYDRYTSHNDMHGFPPRMPIQNETHYNVMQTHPQLPPRLERSSSDISRTNSLIRNRIEEDDTKDGENKRMRRSALLPPHVIKILKDWMMSPEHLEHPYPTDIEKKKLCDETGLDLCQLNNWFANNRKRFWKPTMANRTKSATLYSNENIRNLIYKNTPDPDVSSGLSGRTFNVNLNLLKPNHSENNNTIRYPFPTIPTTAAREGRSHTLDMGHFRRNRMNFQDILNASTNGGIQKDEKILLPSIKNEFQK